MSRTVFMPHWGSAERIFVPAQPLEDHGAIGASGQLLPLQLSGVQLMAPPEEGQLSRQSILISVGNQPSAMDEDGLVAVAPMDACVPALVIEEVARAAAS